MCSCNTFVDNRFIRIIALNYVNSYGVWHYLSCRSEAKYSDWDSDRSFDSKCRGFGVYSMNKKGGGRNTFLTMDSATS